MPTFKQSILMIVAGAGLLVLGHYYKDLAVYLMPAGGALLVTSNVWNRRSPEPAPVPPRVP